MDKPCVYITQEQPHINYAQAELFGDIVFVSEHDLPTVAGSLRARGMVASMTKTLADYRPGVDYLLPSGSPINIATVMMLAGRTGSKHMLLKWENRMNSYNAVHIEVL